LESEKVMLSEQDILETKEYLELLLELEKTAVVTYNEDKPVEAE
jgi:hypothetical protein